MMFTAIVLLTFGLIMTATWAYITDSRLDKIEKTLKDSSDDLRRTRHDLANELDKMENN